MDTQPEPTRQAVRLRGRSYVAFVFAPAVPIEDTIRLAEKARLLVLERGDVGGLFKGAFCVGDNLVQIH